jgi:hypothetical protein
MPPTLAGFLLFLANVVQIPEESMPPSALINMAFAVALSIVNPALRLVCIPSMDSTGAQLNSGNLSIYALCVYNLGADNIFSYATDPDDAPIYENNQKFFAYFQQKWQINAFVSGVITSSSDQGTGNSMIVQQAAQRFTLMNLAQLKTPWGRTYLGMAQSYGDSTFGLS